MAEPELKFMSYAGFDELPPQYEAAFGELWRTHFFVSPSWFAYLVNHFYRDREEFRLLAVEEAATGKPLLLFPVRQTWLEPKALGAKTLQAASHWENEAPLCLLTPDASVDRDALLLAFFRHLRTKQPFGAEDGPFEIVRVWPLDLTDPRDKAVLKALRRAGFWLQTYKNSINTREIVDGLDFDAYFAGRDQKFRYNVRSRIRKLDAVGTVTYEDYDSEDNLDRGITDYEEVSEASWKKPISMVGPVHANLIRRAARFGALRLSLLQINGKPVSVQFWIISGPVAHSVRVAYDEHYRQNGLGLVHTHHVLKWIFERDPVTELSFGYGNESYKGKWMRDRLTMKGAMAFNPGTVKGLRFAFKNIVGSVLKTIFVLAPLRFIIRLLGMHPDQMEHRQRN